jgi:hypothetical protein
MKLHIYQARILEIISFYLPNEGALFFIKSSQLKKFGENGRTRVKSGYQIAQKTENLDRQREV